MHKKIIVACLNQGGEQSLREFGTTTSEIKSLATWLTESGCEIIAMESTGVFWKPLYNLFELMDLDAIVVNAAHMKALPGRKTDVKDAEWIADLLRHGLLKASYIPSREQRELREITRYRKSLTEERCRETNRLQKILEGANIKLDSVVKDINGKSARKLLEKIIEDDVPTSEEEISKMIHGRMRSKLGQLVTAIEGITTPLQRKLLAQVIDHIDDLNRRIADLDKLVQDYMDEYEAAITALCDIPGIARRSAEVILAEIGLDMSRFPSAAHLCGWGLSWQLPERGTAKARKNDKRKQAAQDDFDPMRKICTFCKRVLFLGAIPADRSKARQEPCYTCSRSFHVNRHIPHA